MVENTPQKDSGLEEKQLTFDAAQALLAMKQIPTTHDLKLSRSQPSSNLQQTTASRQALAENKITVIENIRID